MMRVQYFFTSFLLIAVARGATEDSCYRHDYPRRAIQWPRAKSGYVDRGTSSEAIIADETIELTDGAKSPVVQAAFNDMVNELKKVNVTSCKVDATRGILKTVTVTIADKTAALLQGVDESYTLELKGTAVGIKAVTEYGARHGIVTLHNMLEIESCVEGPDVKGKFNNIDTAGGRYVLRFDDFEIKDAPRMVHRGLMLDTARSFIPMKKILDVLRVMSRSKMNVFHWHATDDQSFPLVMPKTAKTIHGEGGETCMTNTKKPCLGAYSNEKTYSKDDIKKIIEYARLHGIRVVIEIDMPAHARSWGSNSTEFIECFDENHQSDKVCAEPICGPLALSRNYQGVLQLAKDIVDDLDSFAVKGEVIHLGMDEVKPQCWGKKKTDKLLTLWLEDMTMYAASKGRRIVVWQDGLVRDNKVVVPEVVATQKVIAQVWNDPAKGVELLEKGVDIIWSDWQKMYLPCGRGNHAAAHMMSWCRPWKTWIDAYSVTPETLTKNEENRKKILGGEMALWTEQASDLTIDPLLWPRVTAWAGAAWEARTDEPKLSDPEDLVQPREQLKQFSWTMMRDCVGFTSMQTMWCNYGDAIPDSSGNRATRAYCDNFHV